MFFDLLGDAFSANSSLVIPSMNAAIGAMKALEESSFSRTSKAVSLVSKYIVMGEVQRLQAVKQQV